MAKKIVLCLDGTSNKFAAANTNVVKLYAMLDRTRPDQLSYYQPGIGTIPPPGVWGKFKQWFITRLDLAIAWLLPNHVSDAYRFLMRYYQDGDSIFIFGFSRGAYTARVLAGMLHKVGLLTQGNEELIPFAWDMFKRHDDRRLADGIQENLQPAGADPFPRAVGHGELGRLGLGRRSIFQYTGNNPRRRHRPPRGRARRAARLLRAESLGHCARRSRTGLVSRGALRCRRRLSGGQVRPFRDRAAMDGRQGRSGGPDFRSGHESCRCCRRRDTPKYAARESGSREPTNPSPDLWWIVEYLPKRYKDPANNFAPSWMLHRGRPRHVNPAAKVHASRFSTG